MQFLRILCVIVQIFARSNEASINERMEKLVELPLWSNWKRPTSIPYPNTWHTFTAKSKTGKNFNIKIVDLTPDRFEEVDEFMVKYYYSYEPVSQSLNVFEDEVGFHNYRLVQKACLKQHVSLMAVLDENVTKPEIIGVQKLLVDVKGDQFPEVPGNYMRQIGKLFEPAESTHNIFEMYDTDTIIRGYGLAVNPEYSGLGIGYNLTLSIGKLARALGIKVFQVGYTNIQSQKIGERAGFKLLHEIVYADYKDEQGRVILPVVGTKSFKWGVIEFF